MHEYQNRNKVYVRVGGIFELNGEIKPIWFQSEDSARVEIDKIIDVRRAASLKAGGSGMRYTVRVRDWVGYLFFDDFDGSWFLERGAVKV